MLPKHSKGNSQEKKIFHLFTYGVACGAIRSITRQSVDVVVDVDVVVVPSKLKN